MFVELYDISQDFDQAFSSKEGKSATEARLFFPQQRVSIFVRAVRM